MPSLYLRMGETQRAIEDLNAAVTIRPERDVLFNRGIAYGFAGDIGASLRDFNAVIDADPLFVEAHYMKGKALGIAGDFDGAASSLMNAIELDPQNADAYYLLGLAFLNRGGIDMARANLRQAQLLGHPDAVGLLAAVEEKVRGGLAVDDKTKGVLTIINALMDAKSQEEVRRLVEQYREFDWDRFLAASEKLSADAVGMRNDTDWQQRLRWVRDVFGRAR